MPKPTYAPQWNLDGLNRITPPLLVVQRGHAPNETPSSAYENDYKHAVGEWLQWAQAGSPVALASAHIVETDANGHCALRALTLGDELALDSPLVVTAEGTTCLAAGDFIGNGGALGIRVSGGAGAAGLEAQGGADGWPGVVATGGGDAAGLEGVGGSGGGPGVRGVGSAGGAGVEATASNGGVGMSATSGNAAGEHGLEAVVDTDTVGVYAVYARSLSDEATALLGAASATSTELAAGVHASGGPSSASLGTALRAVVVGEGCAIEALTPAAPVRAPMHIRPNDADPTDLVDGDLFMRAYDSDNEGGLYVRERSFTRGVWATEGGYAGFLGVNRTLQATSSAAGVTLVTAGFGGHAPKRTGTVRLTATCEVGRPVAGSLTLEIEDQTAGVVVLSRDIECHIASSGANERDITMKAIYNLPGIGARTFRLRLRSPGGADVVRAQEASLSCEGVF